MSGSKPEDDRVWERGWDGHTEAQRRRLANLPFIEKLRWLEEAQRFAERLRQGGAGRVNDEGR
jgi:hypothetical protein